MMLGLTRATPAWIACLFIKQSSNPLEQDRLFCGLTSTTPDDLLSDGVFLRHASLLIYDICVPIEANQGGADMWAQHPNHLKFIAIQRQERLGSEPRLGYFLFLIVRLDMYAGLLGSGGCEFICTVLELRKLPPFEQQIPSVVR